MTLAPSSLPVEVDLSDPQDFMVGRDNHAVDTLVIHTTEGGSIAGAVSWWDRHEVIASAHYLIDGKRIVARVAEGDTAYACGHKGLNLRSISIEVVGHCDDRRMWTPEIMAQLVALSGEIVLRHGIPIMHQPGPGICGHADIPCPEHQSLRGGKGHHVDPGKHFPWGAFLEALRDEIAPPLDPAEVA